MRCNSCKLFNSWNDESGSGAECEIFGDGWDSEFMYYDRSGSVCGCYLEICYIKKVAEQRDRFYNSVYNKEISKKKNK